VTSSKPRRQWQRWFSAEGAIALLIGFDLEY